MGALKGSQRKYLRGLAHSSKPLVQIGREGLSENVLGAIDAALAALHLAAHRVKGTIGKFEPERVINRRHLGFPICSQPVEVDLDRHSRVLLALIPAADLLGQVQRTAQVLVLNITENNGPAHLYSALFPSTRQ